MSNVFVPSNDDNDPQRWGGKLPIIPSFIAKNSLLKTRDAGVYSRLHTKKKKKMAMKRQALLAPLGFFCFVVPVGYGEKKKRKGEKEGKEENKNGKQQREAPL